MMDEIIENYASGKIIYATIAPSTEVRNPFFNDDVLKVFNASSHTYQDSYGEYTKAVVFGKTTLGSNGLYSSGILGTLEDGVETWRFESLTWDNS